MYIPRIDSSLEMSNDKEVKDFITITFSEYFKSIKRSKILEKLPNCFIFF